MNEFESLQECIKADASDYQVMKKELANAIEFIQLQKNQIEAMQAELKQLRELRYNIQKLLG